MIRIFLTGDNHFGLQYARHDADAAEKIREMRLDAFGTMVRKANEEDCDLFVVAGDLFDNSRRAPRERDMKTLVEALSDFRGTAAAVLPGNHDYYDGKSPVWAKFEELIRPYGNIILLSEGRPYPVPCGEEDVILYPAPCRLRKSVSGENNLGWIKNETFPDDSVLRIGIAHGAVEGETIDHEAGYFPMTREELEAIPMAVWLLGHTHVPFPVNLREDAYTPAGRIFNAGAHVQTDSSNNTDGECFLIEIDADGNVRAKKYVSGNLRFCKKTIDVTAEHMADDIGRALGGLADDSVVEAVVRGAVTEEEYEMRDSILKNELGRFIEGTYTDSDLRMRLTENRIDAEFAETSFPSKFLKALLREQPKEAQLAYELIKESVREGK